MLVSYRNRYTTPADLSLLVLSLRAFTATSGRKMRFNPNQGVLTGDSPVYIKTSYRNPPNMQPQKGATMGILTELMISLIT